MRQNINKNDGMYKKNNMIMAVFNDKIFYIIKNDFFLPVGSSNLPYNSLMVIIN